FVADVGLVVAQAQERTEGVVGRAEVVLAAQRDRLRFDRAEVAGVAAHAVVELVRRAPELDADVVVDVPGGAQGRGDVAADLGTQGIGFGFQDGGAAYHGKTVGGGGGASLREGGRGGERGSDVGGRAVETNGLHGDLLSGCCCAPLWWAAPTLGSGF